MTGEMDLSHRGKEDHCRQLRSKINRLFSFFFSFFLFFSFLFLFLFPLFLFPLMFSFLFLLFLLLFFLSLCSLLLAFSFFSFLCNPTNLIIALSLFQAGKSEFTRSSTPRRQLLSYLVPGFAFLMKIEQNSVIFERPNKALFC